MDNLVTSTGERRNSSINSVAIQITLPETDIVTPENRRPSQKESSFLAIHFSGGNCEFQGGVFWSLFCRGYAPTELATVQLAHWFAEPFELRFHFTFPEKCEHQTD